MKSFFLSNISHELRTPMIGMLGFSEILKNELQDSMHREMAEEIYISAQRLLVTLDLILDMASIESRNHKLDIKELDVDEVILNSIKIFKSMAQSRKLYLDYVSRVKDVFAIVDESLFARVINNLIINALKFTNKGGVTIETSLETFGENNYIVIKVIDTGIGIARENLDMIFEEFRQASEGFERRYEGIGLGLTITKKSVELMNGSISVTSDLNKGSVFTVTFLAAVKEAKMTGINGCDNEMLPDNDGEVLPDVLLVENDEMARDITQRALSKICSIHAEENGEKGIEAAKKKKYSAVLMDVGLGYGMNGVEVMKEIRKIPGYSNTPVLALTAYAMQKDKEFFLSEGMTHYLSKPFSFHDLRSIVTEMLRKPAAGAPVKERKKILKNEVPSI